MNRLSYEVGIVKMKTHLWKIPLWHFVAVASTATAADGGDGAAGTTWFVPTFSIKIVFPCFTNNVLHSLILFKLSLLFLIKLMIFMLLT